MVYGFFSPVGCFNIQNADPFDDNIIKTRKKQILMEQLWFVMIQELC